MTRAVRSMADRDVNEFRKLLEAAQQTLNALRETQLEQGKILAMHGRALEEIAAMVGGLVVKVSSMVDQVGDLQCQSGGLDGEIGRLRGEMGVQTSMVRRIGPARYAD